MVGFEFCLTSRGSVGVVAGCVSLVSLASSLGFDVFVRFRLGTGIRHSIENATQFVHGTPSEAASQRTLREWHVSIREAC